MRQYRFSCYDEESETSTIVEFSTDSDRWSGYDGPMLKFFDFLKGTGFVFHHESAIGVIDENGDFIDPAEFSTSPLDEDELEDFIA